MKIYVPSASLVKIGALTPLLPSHPPFQVSGNPSVISTNALNAMEYRSLLKIDKAKSLISLESLHEVLSVLDVFFVRLQMYVRYRTCSQEFRSNLEFRKSGDS